MISLNLQFFGGRGASSGAGGAGPYKGYDIESFGGGFTVFHEGDEVYFDTRDEAKSFIDEMTGTKTVNPRYEQFIKDQANIKSADDIKKGDNVISRRVDKDGKVKYDKWTATGDDEIRGRVEPANDITVTKVTKTAKQVTVEGYFNAGTRNSDTTITVKKTFRKNDKAFTRKKNA